MPPLVYRWSGCSTSSCHPRGIRLRSSCGDAAPCSTEIPRRQHAYGNATRSSHGAVWQQVGIPMAVCPISRNSSLSGRLRGSVMKIISAKRCAFVHSTRGSVSDEKWLNWITHRLFCRIKPCPNFYLKLFFNLSTMEVVECHIDSHRYLEALPDCRRYPVPEGLPNSLEVQLQLTFSSFLGKNRYYDELIAM